MIPHLQTIVQAIVAADHDDVHYVGVVKMFLLRLVPLLLNLEGQLDCMAVLSRNLADFQANVFVMLKQLLHCLL